MPYTAAQQGGLPFSGRTPLSRQHSYLAARAVASTRGAKKRRILAYLETVRAATDQGISEATGLPLASVCSLRNRLAEEHAVRAVGRATGRYGHPVTLWASAVRWAEADAAFRSDAVLTDHGELAAPATPARAEEEAVCGT
ncbi:MAG TPA: hypothetical protein DCQ64_19875 [Candidatus Rokubacteria bacterium]|nr:hypothetical protein [Candidatus Rokubacteria bacterium]